MNCPHCHGQGRIVGKANFHSGNGGPVVELTEIGICPQCLGQRVIHCCEGDREQTLLTVAVEATPDSLIGS